MNPSFDPSGPGLSTVRDKEPDLCLCCPKCNSIPRLKGEINFEQKALFADIFCKEESSHNKQISYKEYVQALKDSVKDKKCEDVKKHEMDRAFKFCHECEVWGCNICLNEHSNRKATKGHRLDDQVIEPIVNCMTCNKDKSSSHCTDCYLDLCPNCKESHDTSHAVIDNNRIIQEAEVKDMANKIANGAEYSNKLSEAKDSLIKELTKYIEEAYAVNLSINNEGIEYISKQKVMYDKYKNSNNYNILSNLKDLCLNTKIYNINNTLSCEEKFLDFINFCKNNFIVELKTDIKNTTSLKMNKELEVKEELYCICKLNNKTIAVSNNPGDIEIYNLSNMSCIRTIRGHFLPSWNLSLSKKNSDMLISCSTDGSIKVFNWKNGKCIDTLSAHKSVVESGIELQGGDLITCSDDSSLIGWKRKDNKFTGGDQLKNVGNENFLGTCALLRDGRIITGGLNKYLSIIKINSGNKGEKENNNLKLENSIYSILQLSNSKNIVIGLDNGSVLAYDPFTWKMVGKFTNSHQDLVFSIIEGSDGRLASCSADATVKGYNPESYECLQTLRNHSYWVSDIIEIEKSKIISVGYDKKLVIYT